MARPLLLLVLVSSLGACRQGPGADYVRHDLQRRLDHSFGKGLFAIERFRRRGHYPYSDGNAPHVLIYYSARIKLARDHKLTDWDKLNVGSLVSVLGSGPRAVKGVRAAGNKAGDVLEVNGALAYRALDKGHWKAAVYRLNGKEGAAGADRQRLLPYRRQIKRIEVVGKALQKARVDEALVKMTEALKRTAAAAERRLAKAQGRVTLATGEPGGEYYRQGGALAQLLSKDKHPARAFASAGSLENCRLVAGGEVLFGYAQNDVAARAYGGKEACGEALPMSRLRALCSLYPEAVQIVTRSASAPRRVADLRGKRVNIGKLGSGGRGNALQVLAAAGLEPAALAAALALPLSEAARALREGRIDALFYTSAFPNPLLRRLAEGTPLRVMSLDDATVAALQAKTPYLIPITLPDKTYPGMKDAARTVGVTAMLVARDDAPDARVQTLLSTLFSHVDAISRGSLQAYLIAKATALKGVSIPLHPAAKRFFGR